MMKVKEILWQNRRDFEAIFECEFCGDEETRMGYDDTYFHHEVIPNMVCKVCGKKAPENYEPRQTKYADWETV